MPTALITGVSKGIGRAITEAFLSQGWKVYGISRSDPQLQNPNFVWIGFDLMSLDDYQQIFDQIPEDLDVLVNNAGIAYKVAIENLSTLDLQKQFTINTKAPIWLIKTLMPKLKAKGKIINIGSLSTKMPPPGLSIYAATKTALATFAEAFNMETMIPVATILPGSVDSPIMHTILKPGTDFSKLIQPIDIAKVVWKLISEGVHSGEEIAVVNDNTLDEVEGLGGKVRIINVDRDL